MPIRKLITGGQAGADQGAWYAAKAMGIPTGGTMPQAYWTETGARPDLAEEFGATQHPSRDYPPRTRANVLDSDATLILAADDKSAGTKLTIRAAAEAGKPYLVVRVDLSQDPDRAEAVRVGRWIEENGVAVLNVAGNRESGSPGMTGWAAEFIRYVLEFTQVEKPARR